jgi:hypothetical protein
MPIYMLGGSGSEVATSILQAVAVTWPDVGLAFVNVLQIVALAWIGSELRGARKEREFYAARDREVLK